MAEPPSVEVAAETPQPRAKEEKPAWFVEELKEIDDSSRDLFENYSKIPSNEVIPHVQEMACHLYPTIQILQANSSPEKSSIRSSQYRTPYLVSF